MPRCRQIVIATAALVCSLLTLAGCGTTRSSDTNRTATEQLLISDAIDRAVQTVNLQSLSGQTVFLDDSRLGDVVDKNYLVSTLRQHLLASGCALRSERDQADFVVEARAGAIGTDRNDLLFGVPSMNVPQILPVQPIPAAIPEIPIAKRRDQRGIAKIAVFAYHRETGMPVWQSGVAHQESSANDVWILGAGPFQRGTIYEGTAFAGNTLGGEEKLAKANAPLASKPRTELAREHTFSPPQQFAKHVPEKPSDGKVVPAAHAEPVAAATPPPAAPAAPTPNLELSPVQVQLPPAAANTANPPGGQISARVDERTITRSTGPGEPRTFYPMPADPMPLPQPRVGSPLP